MQLTLTPREPRSTAAHFVSEITAALDIEYANGPRVPDDPATEAVTMMLAVSLMSGERLTMDLTEALRPELGKGEMQVSLLPNKQRTDPKAKL